MKDICLQNTEEIINFLEVVDILQTVNIVAHLHRGAVILNDAHRGQKLGSLNRIFKPKRDARSESKQLKRLLAVTKLLPLIKECLVPLRAHQRLLRAIIR